MEKKVNIILNCFYYGFYLLIAAVAVGMWQAVKQQMIECISPMTTAGQIMQYIVICYVIVSVAGGLYCFKKIIDSKKVILSADKEGLLLQYRNWGVARITAIGFGAVLGIVAFYLMGGYNSTGALQYQRLVCISANLLCVSKK